MSLRPAQDLVAESSKFSLRQFFETAPSPSPSAPVEATAEAMLPASGGLSHGEAVQSPPLHAMHLSGIPRASAPTSTSPREHKFTFNGLMPSTTPLQMQHRLLQQHQQIALQSGVAKTATSPPVSDASELLRLKAQVVTLTDRVSHLNTNLAATSESVVRGNKALTTERAQFHAKFAAVTKKLEATSAALAEAEALPKEAVKNAKLLNAKIFELQAENAQLVQTRATLEGSLDERNGELRELRVQQQSSTATSADAELEAKHADLQGKYEVLSAQHSLVLERQFELNESLEQHQSMLREASADVLAAHERLDASKVEMATADGLVEELDAKLAAVRLECAAKAEEEEAVATAAAAEAAEAAEAALALAEAETAACCPQTIRCAALEATAKAARDKMHSADAADCECLAEEFRFAEAMAKRARAALERGGAERVMVAHVFTDEGDDARCDAASIDGEATCLDACIHRNPLLMGSPYERSFQLARCVTTTTTTTGAGEVQQAVLPERTTTYVKAISEDLKFHMDGSQALYKSSAATGAALRM